MFVWDDKSHPCEASPFEPKKRSSGFVHRQCWLFELPKNGKCVGVGPSPFTNVFPICPTSLQTHLPWAKICSFLLICCSLFFHFMWGDSWEGLTMCPRLALNLLWTAVWPRTLEAPVSAYSCWNKYEPCSPEDFFFLRKLPFGVSCNCSLSHSWNICYKPTVAWVCTECVGNSINFWSSSHLFKIHTNIKPPIISLMTFVTSACKNIGSQKSRKQFSSGEGGVASVRKRSNWNNVPGLLTGGAMGGQLDQTGQCSKNSSFKTPQSRAWT